MVGIAEGEAGLSRVKWSKIDDLMQEFKDFKAETMLNFEAIKQQLQISQFENSSKFESVIQLLESLKAEI